MVTQIVMGQDKNDPGFVEGDKIEHRTRGFADQRIRRIKIGHNIVVIHGN